jgi:myo-inositol-1(or 4)-monophosphatase
VAVIDGTEEHWLAEVTAELAAVHLMARFGSGGFSHKTDGSLLTCADTGMQTAVIAALGERYPGIPVLAEEQSPESQQSLVERAKDGIWCLDPLDGTTNFAAGMPLFAVSLALIRDGAVEFGLVHDPVRRETFTATRGGGARLNGHHIGATAPGITLADAVAVVDFKRLPGPLAVRLATAAPFRSQRSLGSVALDWTWLAAGRFHLYLHGAQRLWDYAAGLLIAREARRAVCVADGAGGECQPGVSLRPRTAVAAADEVLFGAWRRWLAAA